MKEDPTGKATSSPTGEDIRLQIREALLEKRRVLLEDVQHIDLAISKLKEDASKGIEKLENNKKLPEEALRHIEALLRLEGITPSDLGDNCVTQGALSSNIGSSITNAVFSLLEKIDKPMHYKELTKKIQAKGISIPGKNPSATLLSRIARDERFKRTAKRGTYALAAWKVKRGKVRRRRRKNAKTAARPL